MQDLTLVGHIGFNIKYRKKKHKHTPTHTPTNKNCFAFQHFKYNISVKHDEKHPQSKFVGNQFVGTLRLRFDVWGLFIMFFWNMVMETLIRTKVKFDDVTLQYSIEPRGLYDRSNFWVSHWPLGLSSVYTFIDMLSTRKKVPILI